MAQKCSILGPQNFPSFSLFLNRPSRWPRQPRAMLATDNAASSNFTPHWLNSAKITFSNLNVPEVILLRNQIVYRGRCATFYLYFQMFSGRKRNDEIKSLLSQYIRLMSGYILEREVHLCAAVCISCERHHSLSSISNSSFCWTQFSTNQIRCIKIILWSFKE